MYLKRQRPFLWPFWRHLSYSVHINITGDYNTSIMWDTPSTCMLSSNDQGQLVILYDKPVLFTPEIYICGQEIRDIMRYIQEVVFSTARKENTYITR